MPSFAELLQQGSGHAWLFIPSAILLGALHGLEPGHSKTMMAAFIVAVRGTVTQAILLGLAATASHTAVVWGIALGGMYIWQGVDAETFEPYFQLFSALIIIGIALWMVWRTWADQRCAHGCHDHDHDHHHHSSVQAIDTGHGAINVEIFEEGVPPHWQLSFANGHKWNANEVSIEIERPDGTRQPFTMTENNGLLVSTEEIPEPHEFVARIKLSHRGHAHTYELAFSEDHDHHHDHETLSGLDVTSGEYQDAHERAHANDIRLKFADRNVTTWQIVLFGLTGGLIPCPAAITVLLLCLQLKEFTLGFTLVLCFSIGLALVLVTVGAVAAMSVKHATKRWSWFSTFARKAPYFSSVLIIAVGLYIGYHGYIGLPS